MTGYAQAQAVENGWSLRISVRSVNHRFLDLHLRVPEGFEPLEPRIRQIVRERVRRGHLDVTLASTNSQARRPSASTTKSPRPMCRRSIRLRRKFGIQAEPDLAAILRLAGVIGSPAASLEERTRSGSKPSWRAASTKRSTSSTACAKTKRVICARKCPRGSATIAKPCGQSRGDLPSSARPAFARRLEARLKELLGEAQLDPARLAQEAAIAAERSDVSEELARLGSHVQQFESLLAGTPDAGKKLDFLLQEMQRETNTLLSKTPGNEGEGLEITRLALEIKSEIEKLREQVQNIE